MNNKRYRWWHGALFYLGVGAAQLVLRGVVRGAVHDATNDQNASGTHHQNDRETYRTSRLPFYAPPAIAFPIAWSINCVSLIAGGLHVLNLPKETEGRAEFLRLQASAWLLFASFDTAYFELRSPINAALVTFFYSAATVASLAFAARRMEDRTAALSLATTIAWLALANPVAVTQAAWNHDPFWNAGPFLAPPKGWLKASK